MIISEIMRMMERCSYAVNIFKSGLIYIVFAVTLKIMDAVPVPLAVQPFTFPPEVTKGQTATVICAVLHGSGPYTFRWLKDGNPIHDPPSTKVQTSEEFSLLSLRVLDKTRSGNYSCVVSNEGGSAKYTAELVVYEQPEWTLMPSDIEIVLGENARVDCSAAGVPEPRITWKKIEGNTGNGAQSSASSSSSSSDKKDVHHAIASNGSLIFMNVRAEDAGEYSCTASNGVGENISKSISVHVHVPPQFREEFQLLKVRSSHSASLPCEVNGDSPLDVKWSREYLADDYESRQKVQETPLPNGLLSELFITRASRLDAGIYTCTAMNPYGKRQRTVKLVVLEPPLPPSDISVKQIGGDEVTIRWSAPYSGNSPVTHYILQYWRDTGAPPKLEEENVSSDHTSYVLSGLFPGTAYVVRLVAENEFGQSTPSIPVKFVTIEKNPSGYPTDIIVIPSGPHSLLVRWKAPPPDQRNGFIQGYDLGYRERPASRTYAYREVLHVEDEADGDDYQEYTLEDLESGTEYEVVIRAYNGAGKGPLSLPVTAKTRSKGFLSAPQLWLESTSTNSISVKWSNNESKAKNFYYRLSYRMVDGIWKEKVIKNKDQDSCVLSDLKEGTEYEIFIQTVSGLEHSSPSPTLNVRTASDPSSLRSSMPREDEEPSAVQHSSSSNATTATLVISLSVMASAVIIVCIIAGACVYVVRVRSRAQYKADDNCSRRLSEQRSTSEIGRMSQSANFRYVDVNARPLLWCSTPAPPANDYPSPYATLPLRGTPLSKRWQSEGDGLTPAQSERSESLVNQRLDQVEDKTSSCHD